MASHKTLLYLGIFFVIFDILIQFPQFRISILGAFLIVIGYFKFKLYNWLMWFVWILIVVQFINNIWETISKFLKPSSTPTRAIQKPEYDSEGESDTE